MTSDDAEPLPSAQTSWHVRRAIDGDSESRSWIIERFSPLLLMQATQRLGPALRRHHDPEDLVAEVWAIALSNLGDLRRDHPRFAPVLIRYVSTVLSRRIHDLARRAVRRTEQSGSTSQLPAAETSVIGRVARRQLESDLWSALQELEATDREIIVARGIEQRSYGEIEGRTGIAAGTLAVRYHRAVKRLREIIPDSVLDDLPE